MAEGLVLHEQRGLARRELIYYLKAVDRKTGLELGRMGDIHGEGMLLMSDKPLPAGIVYDLSLELPKALQAGTGHQNLELRCEAMWTRRGPRASSYHENGMRFIDVTGPQRGIIGQLIDLFAMPS
ncbi:PilZ domain-containing protein [Deltaproteobacteria bacterium OttesenSCG-928-M10]|nr:PilZ domain-containing protein [Deltaproteobacteria bacterium OttesenSCG-928-M10]